MRIAISEYSKETNWDIKILQEKEKDPITINGNDFNVSTQSQSQRYAVYRFNDHIAINSEICWSICQYKFKKFDDM